MGGAARSSPPLTWQGEASRRKRAAPSGCRVRGHPAAAGTPLRGQCGTRV